MIQIVNYNGQAIKFEVANPEDHLQKCWAAGHFYEEGMLKFIKDRWDKRGAVPYRPIVVDVGACIGNHTLFFAGCIKAYVYAMEPFPENIEHIKRNLQLNGLLGSVNIIPHAAGSHRCRVAFHPDDSGNCGMGKISPAGNMQVGVIPVDEVISWEHQVDILKIDVEGYNLPVLTGARHTIAQDHPDIYIECQTTQELQEAEAFLLPLGYKRRAQHFNATPTYLFYYK